MYNIYIFKKKYLYRKKYKGTNKVQRYKEEKKRPQTAQIRRLPFVPRGTKRYKGSKKRYITGRKPRKYVVYLCTLFVPVKVQRNTNKPQAAHLSAFIRVPFVCTTVYRSGKHTQRRSTEPHNAQKKLTRIIKHQYNTSRSESVQSLQRYRRASSPT